MNEFPVAKDAFDETPKGQYPMPSEADVEAAAFAVGAGLGKSQKLVDEANAAINQVEGMRALLIKVCTHYKVPAESIDAIRAGSPEAVVKTFKDAEHFIERYLTERGELEQSHTLRARAKMLLQQFAVKRAAAKRRIKDAMAFKSRREQRRAK